MWLKLKDGEPSNFKRSEFVCHCGCGKAKIAQVLIDALQELRNHFNEPIHINCGYRCPKYNKKVGGAKKSQHLYGKAADIHMDYHTPKEIAQAASAIKAFRKGGIGVYKTFVHVDVRSNGPARWGLKWR